MTPPPLTRRVRSALFVALRTVFRAIPMSEAQRDLWRSRFLRQFQTVRPLPAQGQVASRYERRPHVRADERCIGYLEYSEEPLPDPLPATLVAFYLPQFHTIPENDEWWGKGFTEWRNVTRALPQFEGHLQPRLPGDLGFYDLRNPQVMRDQAKLAKTYGLSAFCFYFYWFGGKTLLEEPLSNWLNDKSIDFQYCLCWANENWTRRWDGRDDEVLIAQKHSPEDDIAFISHVANYLRDPRYLRVDGKPMLLLYRPMLLPDPKATAERWRTWCRENNIGEIHLAYVQSFERPDAGSIGFDAAVEFPPSLGVDVDATARQALLNPDYAGQTLSWRAMADGFVRRQPPAYHLHRGVNCGWDNEARRAGCGRTYLHATPTQYGRWLRDLIELQQDRPVFINAWNEWAEGAVLEPDAAWGHAWLHATRRALAPSAHETPIRPCVVVHAWYADVLGELLDAVHHALPNARIVVTTTPERAAAVQTVAERHPHPTEIVIYENRGRDLLPFLRVVRRLHHEGEAIVLKLHTKKSPHRSDGDTWRDNMVRSLLADGRGVSAFQAFSTNARLGLLVPAGHEVPIAYYWGANAANVERLCTRLGIAAPGHDATFASGSMYWLRLAAIMPLLDATLTSSDFEIETGQLDGTIAHALERIILHVAKANGYAVAEFGVGTALHRTNYPYA
ncbi:hypothetical protein DWG18_00435 [Lysobacter sp. TY2-98]|uniref:glycoside hydrolase family 99-like domain-containing protein n=1 Tax=Lysobacter sp. TY2-98 TaxID=2290922 RepID=UPI000E2090EE|nr:glycoside hydrolase family 99-like domain-containing protein [Lysobacter sp. TY2-98]AXK70903.1 hypothetical protein DWG18_00435 [Lysobacter sp. TY2-98]